MSFLLTFTIGCALAGLAVSAGEVSPPWFDRHVGPLRMIGYRTWNANCPPYSGCDPTLTESYVVWMRWDSAESVGMNEHAYQLLRLPISHGP